MGKDLCILAPGLFTKVQLSMDNGVCVLDLPKYRGNSMGHTKMSKKVAFVAG